MRLSQASISLFAAICVMSSAPATVHAAMSGGGGGYGGNNGNNGNNNYIPTPATVNGRKFDIAVAAEGSKPYKASTLLFRTKDLTCDFIEQWHLHELPYTEESKSNTTVEFTGKYADNDGNSLVLSGSANGDAVSGTILVHNAKDDQTVTYAFHGGAPGSAESLAAKKDAATPSSH
jgi:hypothetical protein